MSVERPSIEPLGDHDYLVRVAMGEDVITIRMRATPEVVARIGGTDTDETRVIAATIAYLTARQAPEELPGQLDLEDVIDAYDDFIGDLQNQLRDTS